MTRSDNSDGSASHPSSTAELRLVQTEGADAFREWQTAHKQLFEIALADQGDVASFHAQLIGRHLGGSLIVQASSVAQSAKRDRTRVKRSMLDHVEMQVLQSGHLTGEFQGRLVDVRAGDVCLVDLAREMSTRSTEFSVTTLVVPRKHLPKAVKERDLHGIVLDGEKAPIRLLALHLTTIASWASAFTTEEAAAAVQAAFILALSGWPSVEAVDPVLQGAGRSLLQSALDFVDEHLLDKDLGPDTIASSLQMSRSTLYRLFAGSSGISAYVTSRRLDACYDEIAKHRAGSTLIGQIAFAHGFASEAHFSRAFRKRFGASPREVRGLAERPIEAAPQRPAGVKPAVTVWNEWLQTLGRPAIATRNFHRKPSLEVISSL